MGGSVPGCQYIHRDRESGHWRLYHDYFSEAPTFFLLLNLRLRFRIARPLFLRIAHAVEEHDNYFVQKMIYAEDLGYLVCSKFVLPT